MFAVQQVLHETEIVTSAVAQEPSRVAVAGRRAALPLDCLEGVPVASVVGLNADWDHGDLTENSRDLDDSY